MQTFLILMALKRSYNKKKIKIENFIMICRLKKINKVDSNNKLIVNNKKKLFNKKMQNVRKSNMKQSKLPSNNQKMKIPFYKPNYIKINSIYSI